MTPIPVTSNKKIKNPFKFLDSYKKRDHHIFFGRTKETEEINYLLNHYSLFVITGPSGAGKSSLINCRLLTKFNNPDILHYDCKNYISIKRLLNLEKHDSAFDNKIRNYFDKRNKINNCSEEITKLDQEIFNFIEIDENLNQKTEKINDQKEKIKERNLNQEELKIISNEIKVEFINSENQYELLVFDQFEELFRRNDLDEKSRVKFFIELLIEQNVFKNIVISLREEYYSHLVEYLKGVTALSENTLKINYPSINEVTDILSESFQAFNINNYKVENDPDNSTQVKELKKYTKSEQEEIIQCIIDKLISDKIQIEQLNTNEIYLPLLQIYLYEFYKDDFQITYPCNKVPDDFILQFQGMYYPIKITIEEIDERGEPAKIFGNYLERIEDEIIKDRTNEINSHIVNKQLVPRLLKKMVSPEGARKIIKFENKTDEAILEAFQREVWGFASSKNNENILQLLKILEEKKLVTFKDEGTTLTVALVHDSLAKIIQSLEVNEVKSITKIRLKSIYAQFEKWLDNQKKQNLIQPLDFEMNFKNQEHLQNIFIENGENRDKDKRIKFWNNSRYIYWKYRLLNNINFGVLLLLISTILIGVYFAMRHHYFQNKLTKIETNFNEVNNKFKGALINFQSKINYNANEAKSYLFTAERLNNSLRTENSKIINSWFPNISTTIKKDRLIHANDSILGDFKIKFYDNYLRSPEYYKIINLGSRNQLYQTKTRFDPSDSTYLYLFVKNDTKDLLIVNFSINEVNQKNTKIDTIEKNVIDFEPIIYNKNLYIFYIYLDNYSRNKSFQLKKISVNKDEDIIDTIHFSNRQDIIENLNFFATIPNIPGLSILENTFRNDSFITTIIFKDDILQLEYQVNTSKENLKARIVPLFNEKDTITNRPLDSYTIQLFNQERVGILEGGSKRICHWNTSIKKWTCKIWDYSKITSDSIGNEKDQIHSFKIFEINSNNYLALGFYSELRIYLLNDTLKIKNDKDFLTISNLKNGIRSIDVKNNYLYLGNVNGDIDKYYLYEKYYKEQNIDFKLRYMPSATLTGQNGPINNVTLLGDDKLLSTGGDGQIYLWNTYNNNYINGWSKSSNVVRKDSFGQSYEYAIKTDEDEAGIITITKNKDTIKVLNDHLDKDVNFFISDSNDFLITYGDDGRVFFYSIPDFNTKYEFYHNNKVNDFDQIGQYFISCSVDKTANLYKKVRDSIFELPSIIIHDFGINNCGFHLDNNQDTIIYTKDTKGLVREWPLKLEEFIE